jgi:hypothetical protein
MQSLYGELGLPLNSKINVFRRNKLKLTYAISKSWAKRSLDRKYTFDMLLMQGLVPFGLKYGRDSSL